MKKLTIASLSIVMVVLMAFSSKNNSLKQDKDSWRVEQLMAPADLAKIINDGKENIYIYNIGPAGLIKNAIEIGDGRDEKNIAKLKDEVSKLPKDANIVIYCGCCPFGHCPNIRPAFNLLNEMKFSNHKLLNLSQNLKVDWIDKGYPMNK